MAGAKLANGSGPRGDKKAEQKAAKEMSESTESPVLQALAKRLRNAKKRLRGIEEIQAKADAGKALNPDQESALASRVAVLAVIDELERLAGVLSEPLKQELEATAAASRAVGEAAAAAAAAATAAAAPPPPPPPPPAKTDEEWEAEKAKAVAKARADAKAAAKRDAEAEAKRAARSAVDALSDLLYFSNAFDPYNPFSGQDRHMCLAYAQHVSSPLTPEALEVLGYVGKMMMMRPFGVGLSHRDALAACKEVALRYVTDPASVLYPHLPTMPATGAALRETIKQVKGLEFYGAAPPPAPGMAAAPVVPAAVPVAASQPAQPPPQRGPSPPPQPESPVEVPVAAGGVAENLLNRFFGSAAAGVALDADSAGVSAFAAAAAADAAPKNSGPPAFAGDSDLGIEGVPLEDAGEEVSAPEPGALPVPTAASVMAQGLAKGPPGSSRAPRVDGPQRTRSGRGPPQGGRGGGDGRVGGYDSGRGRGGGMNRGQGSNGDIQGMRGRGGDGGRGRGGRPGGRGSEFGSSGRGEGSGRGRGGDGGRGRGPPRPQGPPSQQ